MRFFITLLMLISLLACTACSDPIASLKEQVPSPEYESMEPMGSAFEKVFTFGEWQTVTGEDVHSKKKVRSVVYSGTISPQLSSRCSEQAALKWFKAQASARLPRGLYDYFVGNNPKLMSKTLCDSVDGFLGEYANDGRVLGEYLERCKGRFGLPNGVGYWAAGSEVQIRWILNDQDVPTLFDFRVDGSVVDPEAGFSFVYGVYPYGPEKFSEGEYECFKIIMNMERVDLYLASGALTLEVLPEVWSGYPLNRNPHNEKGEYESLPDQLEHFMHSGLIFPTADNWSLLGPIVHESSHGEMPHVFKYVYALAKSTQKDRDWLMLRYIEGSPESPWVQIALSITPSSQEIVHTCFENQYYEVVVDGQQVGSVRLYGYPAEMADREHSYYFTLSGQTEARDFHRVYSKMLEGEHVTFKHNSGLQFDFDIAGLREAEAMVR